MDDFEILFIVARALGRDEKDASAWAAATLNIKPLSAKALAKRFEEHSESFATLLPVIRAEIDRLKQQACDDVRQLTEQEYKDENEKLLGLVATVRRRILEAGVTAIDVDALALAANVATEVEHRQLGKPKSVVQANITNSVLLFHPQPVRQLAKQELEIADCSTFVQRYLPSSGEVVEAEIVP